MDSCSLPLFRFLAPPWKEAYMGMVTRYIVESGRCINRAVILCDDQFDGDRISFEYIRTEWRRIPTRKEEVAVLGLP